MLGPLTMMLLAMALELEVLTLKWLNGKEENNNMY
jgi:hypothetical protein